MHMVKKLREGIWEIPQNNLISKYSKNYIIDKLIYIIYNINMLIRRKKAWQSYQIK